MTTYLYSCWFGPERFRLMAKALEASIIEFEPTASVTIERLTPPAIITTYTSNSVKLAAWVAFVNRLPDGAKVILIDGDCLLRGPISASAFAKPFDVAFTSKGTRRLPVNGGVVFLRVSERSRAFMREWLRVNDRMLTDRGLHQPYEIKYGGINQAALGYLRERPTALAIAELPCSIYNACHEPLWLEWQTARVIHYKSALRRALWLGPVPIRYRPLVDLHREYQRKGASL